MNSTDDLRFVTFSPATPQVRPCKYNVRNTAYRYSRMQAAHPFQCHRYHANLSDLRTCQHESFPADMAPLVYLAELRVADLFPTAAIGFSVHQHQANFLVAIFPLP